MTDYSLDSLEEQFKQHSENFKEFLQKQKNLRKENGWDSPDFDEDFCLPDALLSIVQEIKQLKRK